MSRTEMAAATAGAGFHRAVASERHAPIAEPVSRSRLWPRAVVTAAVAGAALFATTHIHQGRRAEAAGGSLLARPVLQPVCGNWHDLARRTDRTRTDVAAEAAGARSAFEQAASIDPAAHLADAVRAVTFLDSLPDPGQAGATDADVDAAVVAVDRACRPYA